MDMNEVGLRTWHFENLAEHFEKTRHHTPQPARLTHSLINCQELGFCDNFTISQLYHTLILYDIQTMQTSQLEKFDAQIEVAKGHQTIFRNERKF